MKSLSIAVVGLLAMIPFSCSGKSAQAQVTDPCEGLPPWKFIVEGQTIDIYLREGGVDRLLDGLDFDLSRRELAALLARLNENPLGIYPDLPPQLQGIGGFITAAFLQRFLDTAGNAVEVDQDGNLLNPSRSIAPKVLSGKIRDFVLTRNPSDATRGSGHINVDMCQEDERTGLKYFFHWDIEVFDDQFVVTEEPSPDRARPELDHKLSAKGGSIEVRHVYYRTSANPNLVRILPGAGQMYYHSTPASCVDLFTEGAPPETYGELVSREFCLGRCDHPFIVNTND
jgi:hypothetical protein